jgi:hypothetical protein
MDRGSFFQNPLISSINIQQLTKIKIVKTHLGCTSKILPTLTAYINIAAAE